jgi:hypothetical protein
MKESFLQFLWQYGLFNAQELKTTDGIPVQIENRGWLNKNSGPDFLNVRIRIGDKHWAGQVGCQESNFAVNGDFKNPYNQRYELNEEVRLTGLIGLRYQVLNN